MPDPHPQVAHSVRHVYLREGTHTEPTVALPIERDPIPIPSGANTTPVAQIMTREVRCARQDVAADRLIELMLRNRLGCMPIVNSFGRPVGMVTKLDIIEQMLPPNQDATDSPTPTALMPRTARELMMPIAITLGEQASIAQAAAMMASEEVHHLPIVDAAGQLIGIVSTMDVVGWLATNDGYPARPD